jgi:hypothetical protein
LDLPTDLTQPSLLVGESGLFGLCPEKLRWLSKILRVTKPLSAARVAGDLLFYLNILVKEEGIEKHLAIISKALELYSNFRIAEINALATAGAVGNAARAAGPAARRAKLQKIREIVWRYTYQYWQEHPAYRHDASNTAKCIAEQVRSVLETEGLLTKAGRSETTIARDIAAGIRAGVFQTGQFGHSNGQSAN